MPTLSTSLSSERAISSCSGGVRCGRHSRAALQILFWMLVFLLTRPTRADTILLDFEGLSDGEAVTSQFPGLTFSNAIALQAGVGLNEFEFPPRSGQVVISDSGGPITITFASPVLAFSGYFTYLAPLTLSALDSNGDPLATAVSLFSSNLACLAGPPCFGDPGSSPNELLSVSSASGIRSVVIAGDPLGGSFTLDDVACTSSTSSVPEPSSVALLVSGVALMLTLNAYKRI